MDRVYTVIDLFSLENDGSHDDMCLINYTNRDDAIIAFGKMLKRDLGDIDDGVPFYDDELIKVDALFNYLCANGCLYETSTDKYFIRHEEIQDKFTMDNFPCE